MTSSAAVSRRALGDHAEQLVARWCGGTLAPPNNPGWDVLSATHGRIQVKARSRATSRHLNWFHISHVERKAFDYLVLVLFGHDGAVERAWGMPYSEVLAHAHSTIRHARGTPVTKLAVRGAWTRVATEIQLGRGR